MHKIILKVRYFEGLSKRYKKGNFIFSAEPSPFQQTKLSKTKGAWDEWPVTTKVMKQVQKNYFISYVLSDQVWWCNIKRFLSYSKN